jgi:hypothetical protein
MFFHESLRESRSSKQSKAKQKKAKRRYMADQPEEPLMGMPVAQGRVPPPSMIRQELERYYSHSIIFNKDSHVIMPVKMNPIESQYIKLLRERATLMSASAPNGFTVDNGIGNGNNEKRVGAPLIEDAFLVVIIKEEMEEHGNNNNIHKKRNNNNNNNNNSDQHLHPEGEDIALVVLLQDLVDFVHDAFTSEDPKYKDVRKQVTRYTQLPGFMANSFFACDPSILKRKFSNFVDNPLVSICFPDNNLQVSRVTNMAMNVLVPSLAIHLPLATLFQAEEKQQQQQMLTAASASSISRTAPPQPPPPPVSPNQQSTSLSLQYDPSLSLLLRGLACISHFQKEMEVRCQGLSDNWDITSIETATYRRLWSAMKTATDTSALEFQRDTVTCLQRLCTRFQTLTAQFHRILPIKTVKHAVVRVIDVTGGGNRTMFTFNSLLEQFDCVRASAADIREEYGILPNPIPLSFEETLNNNAASSAQHFKMIEAKFNDVYALVAFDNQFTSPALIEYLFWGNIQANINAISWESLQKNPLARHVQAIAQNHVKPSKANHCLTGDSRIYTCIPKVLLQDLTRGANLFGIVAYDREPLVGHRLFFYLPLARMILTGTLGEVRWAVAILMFWTLDIEIGDAIVQSGALVCPDMLKFLQSAVCRIMGLLVAMFAVEEKENGDADSNSNGEVYMRILMGLILHPLGICFVEDGAQSQKKKNNNNDSAQEILGLKRLQGNEVEFYPRIVMNVCKSGGANGSGADVRVLRALGDIKIVPYKFKLRDDGQSLRDISDSVLRRSLSPSGLERFRRTVHQASSSSSQQQPQLLHNEIQFVRLLGTIESLVSKIPQENFDVHLKCELGAACDLFANQGSSNWLGKGLVVSMASHSKVFYLHNDVSPKVGPFDFMFLPTFPSFKGVRNVIWTDALELSICRHDFECLFT